ncbi:RNA polymerase sigma-70 factor [Flavobacteriaceae bacterium F08102]|nr:RNA polymerase sigma-70 factor [Flavobacteriaceae bacterium F08102]
MKDKKLNTNCELLRKGDLSFFEKLYSNYFEKLCIYLLNFTSDKNSINDAVQDSFLYLWDNRKRIVITSSINSYLYKMAYNRLMDTLRKNAKKNAVLLSCHKVILDEIIAEEEQTNDREEKLKLLEQCIDKLPKRCKVIFRKKKLEGQKNKQIALTLDISIKTVEAHTTKAYIFLRKCFKQDRKLVL